MNALHPEELQKILDNVMQNITNRFTCIQLSQEDAPPSGQVCSVHSTFDGDCHGTLVLFADLNLMTRLAQVFLQEESVTPQDVEDCAKEYFNIICGQVVAGLFQAAHLTSRFNIPSFQQGKYLPDGQSDPLCVLNYTSNCNEVAQLLCTSCPLLTKQS